MELHDRLADIDGAEQGRLAFRHQRVKRRFECRIFEGFASLLELDFCQIARGLGILLGNGRRNPALCQGPGAVKVALGLRQGNLSSLHTTFETVQIKRRDNRTLFDDCALGCIQKAEVAGDLKGDINGFPGNDPAEKLTGDGRLRHRDGGRFDKSRKNRLTFVDLGFLGIGNRHGGKQQARYRHQFKWLKRLYHGEGPLSINQPVGR